MSLITNPVPNNGITTFNNSIVTGTYKFDVEKFTDVNSLYRLFKKDRESTYAGIVQLWNQRKLAVTPLLSQLVSQADTMYTNGVGANINYDIPFEIGLPHIVDNEHTRHLDKPGIGKSKFRIKLSENCYTNTDIITYDLRNGITLFITEDEILEEADGWVYTVMHTVNDDNFYFDPQFLRPSIQYVKITNQNHEYSTQKSSITTRRGLMNLKVILGSGHRSVYHWITGYAHMLKIDGQFAHKFNGAYQGFSGANEVMWFANPKKGGMPDVKKMTWIRTIEALLQAEMMMMEEKDLFWNKGGIVYGSGRTPVPVNLGLYEQMKSGNYAKYKKVSLPFIESLLIRLYRYSDVPFEQRETEFQCGTGFMIEICKLLEVDFRQNNIAVINASDIKGYLQGDAMNLSWGYRFTSKQFPIGGRVTFKHNPAFDNFESNRIQDGPGLLPDSSYMAAIFDVTSASATKVRKFDVRNRADFNGVTEWGSQSNIRLVKPENWAETYWGYELGTIHPAGPAASQEMYSSSQRHGFGVWMQNFSSIWLQDASRTVLIERDGGC